MITYSSSGDFSKMEAFLAKMLKGNIYTALDRAGQEGVDALARATPMDTGNTAGSWSYEILRDLKSYSIIWSNSNVVAGTPVAVLIQLGHGTGTGGYVQGRDYINPALQPIFDRIANDVWKEVTSA
jgi:hypothetical protein